MSFRLQTYLLALFALFGLSFASSAGAQVDITTWQTNLQHTGANLRETTLTPDLVSAPGNFGLLFTQPLDGQTYGQVLYVSAATLGKFGDGTSHNVVYVATQHDSLYAFDADTASGPTGLPLWHDSLLPPGTTPVPQSEVGSSDIQVELGITTTPVIDTSTGTIYIVSKVKTTASTTYQQYLHALDLKTGAEKFGGPVLINPTFAGSSWDAKNGVTPFNPLREHMRSAMVLYNGVVYLSYASHSDTTPYHGEILGYNASTLQPVSTFITTPNGQEGGLWMAGAGPAVDTQGNMFVPVGNGAFDQTSSMGAAGNDWGESILKLPTNTTGPISLPFNNTLNYFTPSIWNTLNNGDLDLGSGGLLLLPDQTGGTHTHLMVGGGKGAVLYVVDRDNLGGLASPDNAVQEIPEFDGGWIFATPAYYNGYIYYAPSGTPLEQRKVGYDSSTGNYVSTTPLLSNRSYSGKGESVFISANGSTNGLVWILRGNGLDVYNATNIQGAPIFTENATVPNGNISCQNTKFSLPMVVNGKAYYTAYDSTNTGHLFVSGIIPSAAGTPAAPTGLSAVANTSSSTTLTWTRNSTNESGFTVSRATAAGGTFTTLSNVGAGVTTYTDTGLTASTQYFYQVVAYNATGNSTSSNIASATTFPLFTPTGLVAYLSLDDGPVAQVADSTGNGHSGTVNGETTYTGSGFINGAFLFHGTGFATSNIVVPNAASLQFSATQSFSISAWVNPSNVHGVEQAILAKSADQGNGYGIYLNAGNHWVFRGPSGDLVGPAATQGVWTEVTAVQNGPAGTRSLYVNGTLTASGAAQPADGAGDLWIGQRNLASAPDSFPGTIDEVRVYNIPLTPAGVSNGLSSPVLSAISNETHGTSGTFGLTLFPSTTRVIESRRGATAGSYSIALTFSAPVSGVTANLALASGGAAVGNVGTVSYDTTKKVMTVPLTGVGDAQALNLHLAGIQPGNGTADIPLNVLWGDVNSDNVVSSLDVAIVQNNFSSLVTQANEAYDINADGVVNGVDVSLVSGAVGTNLGAQTETNLALFQPATASSTTTPNTPALAFDGNVNTRWESLWSDPQWVQVDLGVQANIHTIVLNWENAAGKNYSFSTSTDGQTFTPLGSPVVGNNSGGIKTYSGLNGTGRYVRMTGTTRTTTYGYSLWDFQVIGVPASGSGGTVTAPTITSASTASGTTGTAFTYQIAASGNPTSYGESGTLPAGLSFSTTTGAITGTPTTAGTSSVTVSASNAAGTGNGTLTITVNAGVSVPAVPVNVAAIAGNAQVQISWSASTGATSYTVFRGTRSGGEASLATVSATSYIDATAANGTAYFYYVKATNTAGSSAASGEVSATPAAPVTVPTVPANVTATAGNAQVTLSWAASNGAASYSVYRGTAAGAESATPLFTGLTTTSRIDNSAANGVTYFYKVAAVNTAGTSAMSNEVSATPAQPSAAAAIYQIDSGGSLVSPFVADKFYNAGSTGAHTAPINVTAANTAPMAVYQTERYGSSFNYTLPALTAGASYTVRLHFAEIYWTKAGQRVFNVAINGTNVLSNFDIVQTAGGPMIAVVKTFTASATSAGQIVIAFTTGSVDVPKVSGVELLSNGAAPLAPLAPTSLTATAGNASVTLAWVAGNGTAGQYSVYRGTAAGAESTTAIATGLSGTSYTDSAVTNGTPYFYKVASSNSSGVSPLSNEASATPAAAILGTPVYQVNSGGAAVAPFAADAYVTGGNTAGPTPGPINLSGVTSPAPAMVYQTERWGGPFTYVFPKLTPGANYLVRLHFAENYWDAAGQRIFNVSINGTTVLTNFDVLATAGAKNTAIVEQFTAKADASGNITVYFFGATVDQPKSSAIEIYTQ